MELEHYKQCLHCKTLGFRSQARQHLQQFIASFTEKELWTHEFLENQQCEYEYGIRYELYEQVVFPVLLSGYQKAILGQFCGLLVQPKIFTK
jgi:hypothetical protein